MTSDFTQAWNTNVKQSQRVCHWRFGLLTAACPRRWCVYWCVPSTHPSVRWWPSLLRPWSLWKALQGGCEGKRSWLISSQTCLVGISREVGFTSVCLQSTGWCVVRKWPLISVFAVYILSTKVNLTQGVFFWGASSWIIGETYHWLESQWAIFLFKLFLSLCCYNNK